MITTYFYNIFPLFNSIHKSHLQTGECNLNKGVIFKRRIRVLYYLESLSLALTKGFMERNYHI